MVKYCRISESCRISSVSVSVSEDDVFEDDLLQLSKRIRLLRDFLELQIESCELLPHSTGFTFAFDKQKLLPLFLNAYQRMQ